MVLAPSSGDPTCPFLMASDSSEMAKIDLWCLENDVHLQDLSKEIAEICHLPSISISGFGSLAIEGLW